jgi:hypothetical protein
MKFNSQICTSREQSERLLALGLKKETADCYWFYCDIAKQWKCTILSSTQVFKDYPTTVIPAWSLHRLIEMMPQIIGHLELAVNDAFVGYYEDRCESETGMYWEHTEESSNLYDNIIYCIEWLIKKGYFNREYLV